MQRGREGELLPPFVAADFPQRLHGGFVQSDQNFVIVLVTEQTFVCLWNKLTVHAYVYPYLYRARNKGMHILLSSTQAGPGRTVTQEHEEISRNH